MYFISCVALGMAFCYFVINCENENECINIEAIFGRICGIFWDFGNICLYMLYYQRIYHKFNYTMLPLNKIYKIILGILIILYGLSSLTQILPLYLFILNKYLHTRRILSMILVQLWMVY